MGGGAKTIKSTQTDQSKTADAMAAGYFPGLYNLGEEAVTNARKYAPPQEFLAGPTEGQLSGVKQIYGAAGGLGAAAGPLSDMAKKVASGFFLDPRNDPTFAGAASAAIDPITRQLQEKILPGLIDQSIKTGGVGTGASAYGGASLGLNQAGALKDWETQAGNITADMAAKSRAAGMGLTTQAGSMAEAANKLALAPGLATGAAGSTEQQFAQSSLDNLLKRYQMNVEAPWQGLQGFANLLTTGGFNRSTGTETETTQSPPANLFTQLLQGGTGLAGMAGSLFGSQKGGESAASAIGGGLSSAASTLWPLLMGLSDRRFKKDIKQVGTAFNGLPIYVFRYISGGPLHMGFMADEVQKLHPDAVEKLAGVAFVDYEKAVEL